MPFCVTLAELKTYLGISDSSQDVKLQLILDSLCTWLHEEFKSYGILLEETVLTEFHDGDHLDHLIANFRPIVSVASIHVSQQQIFDATTLVPATDYRIYNSTGIIRLINTAASFLFFPGLTQQAGLSVFGKGVQNIRLVYTAGFSTFPADVKMAVMTVVGKFRSVSGVGGGGAAFSSERLGDYSYTLRDDGAGGPNGSLGAQGVFMVNELKLLLDHYLKATMVAGA